MAAVTQADLDAGSLTNTVFAKSGTSTTPYTTPTFALTIPAAGGKDTSAIILGDYSNGNDGIVLKNAKSLADIKGRKSTKIVQDALQILCNLEHRGAVGAGFPGEAQDFQADHREDARHQVQHGEVHVEQHHEAHGQQPVRFHLDGEHRENADGAAQVLGLHAGFLRVNQRAKRAERALHHVADLLPRQRAGFLQFVDAAAEDHADAAARDLAGAQLRQQVERVVQQFGGVVGGDGKFEGGAVGVEGRVGEGVGGDIHRKGAGGRPFFAQLLRCDPPAPHRRRDVAALVRLGTQRIDSSVVERTLGTVLKYREDQGRVREHGIDALVAAAVSRAGA